MCARNDKWNGEDWEPTPLPAAPCRGPMEEQLERLRERLLAPLLSSVANPALIHQLRRVANEAAALAWLTACPLLVLPMLLEEKIHAALQRWERQQRLWRRHIPTPARTVAGPATAALLPRIASVSMAA
jgi:hypothetical protein